MKEDLNSFLPLSSATLHILLSLAGDDLHGYGIMQEVSRDGLSRSLATVPRMTIRDDATTDSLRGAVVSLLAKWRASNA